MNPDLVTPTEENLVKLMVVATAEGYLPTSQPVIISEEADYEYVVQMLELDNPADGVVVMRDEDIGTAGDGIVDEDIVLSTDDNELSITIKGGTVLKDSDGNVLNGTLSALLAYFDPTEDKALSAFPGGLNVTVSNEQGVEEEGFFTSAGFAAIEIRDQQGRKAAKLEGSSIDLAFLISQRIINPETGVKVADGDTIPLWSYNEKTGEWAFERNTVVETGQGGLLVRGELPHLSFWNVDWYNPRFCRYARIYVDGDESITGWWPYTIVVSKTGYKRKTYRWIKPGYSFVVFNVPKGNVQINYFPRQVSYCDVDEPTWVFDSPVNVDLCSAGSIHAEATLNPNVDIVRVKVFIKCTDTGIKFRPKQRLRARFRKVGDCWRSRTVINGEITVGNVERDADYEIQVYYKGRYQPASPFLYHYGEQEEIVFVPEIDCGG